MHFENGQCRIDSSNAKKCDSYLPFATPNWNSRGKGI